MMDAVVALAPAFGLTAGACAALNVSRASIYRRRAHPAQPLARSSPTLRQIATSRVANELLFEPINT
jgi:putative transposase